MAPLCGEPDEAEAQRASELRALARLALSRRLSEVHRCAQQAEALALSAHRAPPPRGPALRATVSADNAAAGFYGECADAIEAAMFALIAAGTPGQEAEQEALAAIQAALVPVLLAD